MKSAIFSIIFLLSLNLYAESDIAQIEKYEAFDNWIYGAFEIENPETESSILKLGESIKVSEQEYIIGHAANPLKAVICEFHGLEVQAIIEQTEFKIAHIIQITIDSSSWPLSNGITVGQEVSVLSKLLVSPNEGTLKYCGLSNCVEFMIKDNIISVIKISLYAD